MVAGIDVSADSVLGTEKGHEIHLGCVEEDVDGGAKTTVHTAGVGNQPHTLACEFLKTIAFQHFDSRDNLGAEHGSTEKKKGNKRDKTFHRSNIIIFFQNRKEFRDVQA